MSLEQVWSRRVVLDLAGQRVEPEPKQLAALEARGRMTDALLKLMEPYVWWPPAPSELLELEMWLALGAAVWNATVKASTSNQLREQLAALAETWDGPDDDDPVELVEEIATRKLQLFADDDRVVGSVTVRANGGNAEVEAMSLARLG